MVDSKELCGLFVILCLFVLASISNKPPSVFCPKQNQTSPDATSSAVLRPTTHTGAEPPPYPAINCSRSTGSRIALIHGRIISSGSVLSEIQLSAGFWEAVYSPAIETLRLGLNSRAPKCGYEVLPLQVVIRGTKSTNSTLQDWLGRPNNTSTPPGDMVIFVGEAAIDSFISACALKPKWQGARCVLYWTEPRPPRSQYLASVQEVWFYSRRILNLTLSWNYTRSSQPSNNKKKKKKKNTTISAEEPIVLKRPVIFRYVPPGFVRPETMKRSHAPPGFRRFVKPPPTKQKKSDTGLCGPPPIAISSPVETILFLGQLKDKAAERRRNYQAISENPLVGPRLRNRYNIFRSSDWAALIPHVNTTAFLNLHRLGPDLNQPIEAFRLSQLLSMGAVVVSQVASADDLAEYNGMLLVERNIDAPRWSPHIERLLFSNESKASAELAKWQEAAYRKFRARFMPPDILHRASVWSLA